jgi:hypothetical protein
MPPSTASTTHSKVPYFPPPPKHASSTKAKPKRCSAESDEYIRKPPQTLRRSRQFLLPNILILTFITTILSLVYAYCISAPHTRITQQEFDNNPDIERDDSLFRRATMFKHHRRDTSWDGGSYGSSPNAAMLAYTLAAPVATLLYIFVELTLHITRPVISVMRRTHLIFLCCTSLLAAGWAANLALWTQCEMPAASLTMKMHMCPASVRGHFMFGIHELSIAKVVLGWIIVVGLFAHAYCIVKNMRDIRKYGGAGLGIKHGSVRMVLEMEEGARVQRTLRRGYKKNGVRIAEGY